MRAEIIHNFEESSLINAARINEKFEFLRLELDRREALREEKRRQKLQKETKEG